LEARHDRRSSSGVCGSARTVRRGASRKAALNLAFKWVNTTLGNIKSAITGTYRTIRDKHVPRYLAEFEYRFNRQIRSRRHDATPRLSRTPNPADAIPPPQIG
jgi:hypothetical protein